MRIRRWLLGTYALLLWLYPSAFRRRFGTEMLELAARAEFTDWPFVFGDTGLGIVRCWIEGGPSSSSSEANLDTSFGGSSIRSLGLGFALSTAILASLAYIGYRWPPPCPTTRPVLTHVVMPPRSVTHEGHSPQIVQAEK